MTRVDFYILPLSDEAQRLQFACKLTEKAWNLGHRVLLYADSEAQANALDQLLWQTRPESFLPHNNAADKQPAPIEISCEDDPGDHHDVLINLALEIPGFFSRFERVSEIVCQEPQQLTASRERWKFYQDRGYPLKSHKL